MEPIIEKKPIKKEKLDEVEELYILSPNISLVEFRQRIQSLLHKSQLKSFNNGLKSGIEHCMLSEQMKGKIINPIKKVRILFPPSSLYDTLNTPQAWKAHPGSPIWNYDGQFIWIVKEQV